MSIMTLLFHVSGVMSHHLWALTSNRTVSATAHTAHVSMMLLFYVFGNRIISMTFGHYDRLILHLWLLSEGTNERCCLQTQSSHFRWTEGSHRKFHLEHSSDCVVACLCKHDKTCRCVSTSTWGPFPISLVVWEMYLYFHVLVTRYRIWIDY